MADALRPFALSRALFFFTLVPLSSFLSLPPLSCPFSYLSSRKKLNHGRNVGRRRGRALLRVHRRGGGARLQLCVLLSFFSFGLHR